MAPEALSLEQYVHGTKINVDLHDMRLQNCSKSVCKDRIFKYLINKYENDNENNPNNNNNIDINRNYNNANFNNNNNNNSGNNNNIRNNNNNRGNNHHGIYQGWRHRDLGPSRWER